MEYTPAEQDYFEFIFDSSVTCPNTIDCRYGLYPNGKLYPSVECVFSPGRIIMKLHFRQKIESTNKYRFVISTRYQGITEGLQFTQQGIYTLSVYSYSGGVKTRSGKARFEVWGRQIDHFFIYSANKVAGEPTLLTLHSEFWDRISIDKSDPVNDTTYTMLVVFFQTSNNGFLKDLNTGLPEFSQFPCDVDGLNLDYLDANSPNCQLYYGYNGAPTKIEITNYQSSASIQNLIVRTPLIYNPVTHQVPNVWFEIQRHTRSSGDLLIDVLYEGHYDHLNYTYFKNVNYQYTPFEQDIGSVQSFCAENKLEEYCNFDLTLNTPVILNENDVVAYKFPSFWPLLKDYKKLGFRNGDTNNSGCPSGVKKCYTVVSPDQLYYLLVFQLNRNWNPGEKIRAAIQSPSSQVPTGLDIQIEQYIYKHTRLVKKNYIKDFTKVLTKADDILNPQVQCELKNPVEGESWYYTVKFQLPHDMPVNSQLKIEAFGYTENIKSCSQTSNSKLQGDLVCEVTGNYANIYNFNTIKKNNAIEIQVNFKNPPFNNQLYKWRVSSYFINSTGFHYLRGDSKQFTHDPSCKIIKAGTAGVNDNEIWPHMHHLYNHTRIGEVGPINYHLKFPYEFNINDNHKVFVTLPKDFVLSKGEFVAIWNDNMFARQWDVTEDASKYVFKILFPKEGSILKTQVYKLTLTTLNAQNNKNGFIYPATHRSVSSNVAFYEGSSKIREQSVEVEVFGEKFTSFEVKFVHQTPQYQNMLLIYFQQPTVLVANTKLVVKIDVYNKQHPTVYEVFDVQGGTNKLDWSTIPCYFFQPTVAFVPVCDIFIADKMKNRKFTIEVSNISSNIAAGTNVLLVIDGFRIMNTSNDEAHIEVSLQSEGSQFYFDQAYANTLQKLIKTDFLGQAEPLMSSYQLGNTNIQMSMTFKCSSDLFPKVSATDQGFGDFLLLVFPKGFTLSAQQNTEAKLSSGGSNYRKVYVGEMNNIIAYKPDVKISKNTSYTFQIRKFNQATIIPKETFQLFCIKNYNIESMNTYVISSLYTALAIDNALIKIISRNMVNSSQLPNDCHQQFQLEVKTDSNIGTLKDSSSFSIVLPSALLEIDTFCENASNSELQPYNLINIECSYDPASSTFKVFKYQELAQGSLISINFYAKTPKVPTAMALTLKIFEDQEQKFLISTNNINFPAINPSITCFKDLDFHKITNDGLLSSLVKNSNSPLIVFLKTKSTWTASSSVIVQFPTSITLPTESTLFCFFNNQEAPCTLTSSSPLKIQVSNPLSSPLTANTYYELKILPKCGDQTDEGFRFNNNLNHPLVVVIDGNQFTLDLQASPKEFMSVEVIPLHYNKGVSNALIFKFKINNALTSANKIRISFPLKNKDNMQSFLDFQSTQTYSTNAFTCKSLSLVLVLNNSIGCDYGFDGKFFYYEFSNFNAISSGSLIELIINDLKIRSTVESNNYLDIKIETLNGSIVMEKQVVREVLFAHHLTSTDVQKNINITRTKNAFGSTSVEYTFLGVDVATQINKKDRVVFHFPNVFDIPNPLSNCGTQPGQYKAYSNVVIFTPSSSINQGTFNFCFSGAKNPSTDVTEKIAVMVVYNHYILKRLLYDFQAMTPLSFTVTGVASSSSLASTYNTLTFSITTTQSILDKEQIQIEFPIAFKVIDVQVTSTWKFNYELTYNATNNLLKLSAITDYYVEDGAIAVRIQMLNAGAGSHAFKASILKHAPQTFTLAVTAKTNSFQCALKSQEISPTSLLTFVTTSTDLNQDYILQTPSFTLATPETCTDSSTPPTVLTCSSSGIGITVSAVPNPAEIKVLVNKTDLQSYQFQYLKINNKFCQGIPYLQLTTGFTAFTFKALHSQIQSHASLKNFFQFDFISSMYIPTGHIFVDIINIGLKQTFDSSKIIPCVLKVDNILETSGYAMLKLQSEQMLRIQILFNVTIFQGSTVQIYLYQLENPSDVRTVQVYLRHVTDTFSMENSQIGFGSFTTQNYFPSTSIASLTGQQAQNQILLSLQFSSTLNPTTHEAYIFTPDVACNRNLSKYTILNPQGVGAVAFEGSNCAIKATNFVSNSASVDKFQFQHLGSGPIFAVVLKVTGEVVEAKQFNVSVSQKTLTATTSELVGSSENDFSFKITINVNFYHQDYFYLRISLPSCFKNFQLSSDTIVIEDAKYQGYFFVEQSKQTLVLKGNYSLEPNVIELNVSFVCQFDETLSQTDGFVESYYSFNENKKIAKTTSFTFNMPSLNQGNAFLLNQSVNQTTGSFINQRGKVSFVVKFNKAFAATDYINIKNSSFGDFSSGQLMCVIKEIETQKVYLSQKCFYDNINKKFIIKAPLNMGFVENKYVEVIIETFLDVFRSLLFPAQNLLHVFEFEHVNNLDEVIEQDKMSLGLGKNKANYFCAFPLHSQSNSDNVVYLKFKPNATITATSNLLINFYTKSLSPIAVSDGFPFNMKLVKSSGSQFKCQGFTRGLGQDPVENLFINNCQIFFGSNSMSRKIRIKVNLSDSLSSGTNYMISLQNIFNPAALSINGVIQMYVENGTSILDVFHSSDLLFTQQRADLFTTYSNTLNSPMSPKLLSSFFNHNLSIPGPAYSLLKYYDGFQVTLPNQFWEEGSTARYGGGSLVSLQSKETLMTGLINSNRSSNQTLTLDNLIANSSSTFNFSFQVWIVKNRVVQHQFIFQGVYTVTTAGFRNLSLNLDKLRYSKLTPLLFSFENSVVLPSSSFLKITLKNGERFTSSCFDYSLMFFGKYVCELETEKSLKIKNYSQIASNLSFNLQLNMWVTKQVGQQLCVEARQETSLDVIIPETCINIPDINSLDFDFIKTSTFERPLKVQSLERAPLTFDVDFPVTLVKNQDFIEISVGGFFFKPSSSEYFCMIDSLLANYCYFDYTKQAYLVGAPRDTDIVAGQKRQIYIQPYRESLFTTNTDKLIPFPVYGDIKNLIMKFVTGSTSTTYSRNKYKVLEKRWTQDFFNTYIVQNNKYSNYRLQFVFSQNVAADARIRIEFPTVYKYGNVFQVNLGTTYYNGQEFPCLLNTNNVVPLKCYVFHGNPTFSAAIIIYPNSKQFTNGQKIDVTFPLLLNPVDEMSEIESKILAQTFDSATLTWKTHIHWDDYLFVAKEISITSVNVPVMTMSPGNMVGQISTASFSFVTPVTLDTDASGAFDKIVIYTDKKQYINLNNNTDKKLVVTGFKSIIYNQNNLIELSPLTKIHQGSNVTLNLSNYFNQQYVIPDGVSFVLDVWSGGYVSKRFRFNPNIVLPNKLTSKVVTYKNNELETNAFDTYEFNILPKNGIPVGGFIYISFHAQFTNFTNCEVFGGIKATCQIETYSGADYIKLTLKKQYVVDVDKNIRFKIDMKNPATAGTYSFSYISFYNENERKISTNFAKIDEDLLVTYTYSGFPPFTFFEKSKLTVWVKDCCSYNDNGVNSSGYINNGVFRFKVKFATTLKHEASSKNYDALVLTNVKMNIDTRWSDSNELLCYFDLDSHYHSIKSEYCTITGDNAMIQLPEEVTFDSNNEYIISIMHRGRHRGVYAKTTSVSAINAQNDFAPPRNYFLVESNKTSHQEVAIIDMNIRPCYFSEFSLDVMNWHTQYPTTIEIKGAIQNPLHLNSNNSRYRLQVLWQTYNEMKKTQNLDFGFSDLASVNSTKVLPAYYHTDTDGFRIQNIWYEGEPFVNFYKQSTHDIDKQIVANFYQFHFGPINYQFRLGMGPYKNYEVTNMDCLGGCVSYDGSRNTFTDITFQFQYQLDNGLWVAMEERTHYRAQAQIYESLNEASVLSGSQATISTLTLSAWHTAYTFNHNGGNYNHAYYDLEWPYDVKFRNATLETRSCSHVCNFYPGPSRRFVFQNVGSSTSYTHTGYSQSPAFRNTRNLKAYFVAGHRVVKIMNGKVSSTIPEPEIVLENEIPNNPVNQKIKYRIAIYLRTIQSRDHKYVRVYLPSDFSDVSDCKIKFGFRIPDVTDIHRKTKCKVTANHVFRGKSTTLLEFYDLYHYSQYHSYKYEEQFIFEVKMKNPPISKWTEEVHSEWFDNFDVSTHTYDQSRIQIETVDGTNKGRFWVGETVPVTNYFRVFRNRKSFIDRKQKLNEWGELQLRVFPQSTIPNNTGIVEIQLPLEFDLADGGTKICEVGHFKHEDLEGQFCEITNERKIRVKTNANHGLLPQCSLVRITTENSLYFNNGFQAPSEIVDQDFDLYLWDDTVLKEYTNSSGQSESTALVADEDLFITTTSNECDEFSFLKVRFHTNRKLFAGYDKDLKQTDQFAKNPITYIELQFNTYDRIQNNYNGFPLDLSFPQKVVPCQSIFNMVPKDNESLRCEISEIHSERDFYRPVVVKIFNFKEIEQNVRDIEFHLMDIIWTNNSQNLGSINFRVMQKKGNGDVEVVFESTQVQLLSQTAQNRVYINESVAELYPKLSENFVGGKINISFFISSSIEIYDGDVIELTFPSEFIFPPSNEISATVFYKVQESPTVSKSDFKKAILYVYPSINKLHVQIPQFFNIIKCQAPFANQCKVEVQVQGMRNAAFSFNYNYELRLKVVKKKKSLIKKIYPNMAPPSIASFVSLNLNTSSNYQRDINVDYFFEFIPSYYIFAKSTIIIDMKENLFKHINKSSPEATCTTNFESQLEFCAIQESRIFIKVKKDLSPNQICKVTLQKVKNPDFVGQTDSNDIGITALHSNGYKTHQGYFNSISFQQKKNIETLFLGIDLSSFYQSIEAEYVFTIQTTTFLPKEGNIEIVMPADWAMQLPSNIRVKQMTGNFSSEKLIFQHSFIKEPNGNVVLQIVPQFATPSKSLLKIFLSQIKNPQLIFQTKIFSAQTKYDSQLIDQKDPEDQDNFISYLAYEPKIQLWKSNFYPKNEGEVAVYSFIFSSKEAIVENTEIMLSFSEDFEEFVAEPTKGIVCSSKVLLFAKCLYGNRKITFVIQKKINPFEEFDVEIDGILNPNNDLEGHMSFSTLIKGKLSQYSYALANFKTVKGPPRIVLSKLTLDYNQVLATTNYLFCTHYLSLIPKNSVFFIDLPKQFIYFSKDFKCFLSDLTDETKYKFEVLDENKKLACSVKEHIRRIEIHKLLESIESVETPPIMDRICFVVKDFKNAFFRGQSFNFVIKIFDPDTQLIIGKSFGHLDYPSNVVYLDNGFKIFVQNIDPIYKLTISQQISVQLEKAMSYEVILTPICENFEFEPTTLVFSPAQKTQSFRIKTNEVNEIGTYNIVWKKEEKNEKLSFQEMKQTPFEIIDQGNGSQLSISISQNVYSSSINAQSLPVKVTLSNPFSKPIKIFMNTIKPTQTEFVKFSSEYLEFQPGQTEQSFTYQSLQGSLSGLLKLEVEENFKNLFKFDEDIINIEVLDKDTKSPEILMVKNEYLSSSKAKFRVSVDENAKIHYLLTQKGTPMPEKKELIDKALRKGKSVFEYLQEQIGQEFVDVKKASQSYVYHDSHIKFENLIENTDYMVYVLPEDLSGNIGEITQHEFKTKPQQNPLLFKLQFSQPQDKNKLLESISLVTGQKQGMFKVVYEPEQSGESGQGAEEDTGRLYDYTIQINPSVDQEDTELQDILQSLDDEKESLLQQLPMMNKEFDFLMTHQEIYNFYQNFTYIPFLVESTTSQVSFNVSSVYSGKIYGVIQLQGLEAPSSVQIKQGLDFRNQKLPSSQFVNTDIQVQQNEYKIWPSQIVSFDFLYHSSSYDVFFTAERIDSNGARLMEDDQVVKIRTSTTREIFVIPESYIYVEDDF